MHFHSLRHTFATRALEAGIPIKYCSTMLGHASTGITENLYAHASEDQLRKGNKKTGYLIYSSQCSVQDRTVSYCRRRDSTMKS
ncbi:MAG: tyrosine-type recombinase/integrase [[Clostridium] innocuum]